MLIIGRFTIWPILLFNYKIFLRLKIKTKHWKEKNIAFAAFFKKYLPGSLIALILVIVTSNNILAQSYNIEEYANKTMLSALFSNQQEGWSEIIEERGPAGGANIGATSYLEERGNLQAIAINSPIEEKEAAAVGISTDSSSLVLIGPETEDMAAPAPEQIVQQRNETIVYTVEPGDVLGKIAEKFAISTNTILWANNLTWNSVIRPGQELKILPSSGINHEIKSGDTISAIAQRYQADANKIIEANQLASATDIKVGDLVFVPSGIMPTRVVSSYQPRPTPVAVVPTTPVQVAPAENIDTGTKLLWPVISQRITQYYHWGHSGLDIGDKSGNPIYAAESGKVERSGWANGYGYHVIVNHGNGIQTLYAHASKLLVEAGDSVSRGDTIALVGSTGWSTGPHLHLEVRVNGVRQNPLNYIK
ncbi:MAG: peptidoglycan DD-metalloendopeptidase family protein [Patescibacteria group bacterium]|nr:peptidoglycan DD-metalloendopeptidase family protein [Patescibacteria group bacterium]